MALLKLKRKAMYTNTVRPICLPPKQLKLEGWRGTVTGWGKTESSLGIIRLISYLKIQKIIFFFHYLFVKQIVTERDYCKKLMYQ